MSKLDELDKEFIKHGEENGWNWEIAAEDGKCDEELLAFTRKYYDLGKLEEREALKKQINSKKKKVITGNWEDMNLNEIVFNISDRTYNLAVSDLLSTLNNEK